MSLKEIANELVAGCRENRVEANLDKLYAPDVVSVEAADMGNGRSMTGLDALKGKHAWWNANAEVHSASVDGPFLHGDDSFAVIFSMDVTMKPSVERSSMQEVGVYHVKNDKIVREEFFYGNGA